MVRITDRTLSCLDAYKPDEKLAFTLAELLLSAGIDLLELSEGIYRALSGRISRDRLVIRLENGASSLKYPEIRRFVCRKNNSEDTRILTEIQANDIREINLLTQYSRIENVRICGLDDLLLISSENTFGQLKSRIHGRIELCPENSYGLASANAVEWILQGNTDVVTAFSGIGGFAATEEVLIALRSEIRYKPNQPYTVFPKIKKLLEKITNTQTAPKKAVIGDDIFCVEAGIHVDGINKSPKNYEPFPPELVGRERSFVTGKHSGKRAVFLKMKELDIDCTSTNFAALLEKIKRTSIEKNGSLTDEEFCSLL